MRLFVGYATTEDAGIKLHVEAKSESSRSTVITEKCNQ